MILKGEMGEDALIELVNKRGYEIERLKPDASDYDEITDAIEEHLDHFIHEDDVAAIAIYCEAIEHAGKFVKQVIDCYRGGVADTDGHCIFCGSDVCSGHFDNDNHNDDCPMRMVNIYLEIEEERIAADKAHA